MDATAMRALGLTAAAAQGATSVDGYCQAVIGHMANLLGSQHCSILLVRDGRFHHAAAVGLDPEYMTAVEALEVREDIGSCGPAILTGRTTVSEDIQTDPRWEPVRRLALGRDLHACWSVPLRPSCGVAIGSLGIYHQAPGGPTPAQLTAAETLADVLALGIDGLQHQAAATAASEATIHALMSALDARDAYTGGHSAETAELAMLVGERLGLDAAELAVLRRAAELHDIGKLAVPDEVLHCPTALDEGQTAIMRTHPVVGATILGHVPGMEAVARAVRHEHERWDGGGYPDGIAKEDIPIASRVVLACDAWHAMTSDRPYRASLGPTKARQELRDNAGTQFDPRVVEALLAVLSA